MMHALTQPETKVGAEAPTEFNGTDPADQGVWTASPTEMGFTLFMIIP